MINQYQTLTTNRVKAVAAGVVGGVAVVAKSVNGVFCLFLIGCM
jgi:hypothetical protein